VKGKEKSELVVAAEALEHELERFEGIVAESMRGQLDSQKGLERAAEALKSVVAADQRITDRVNTLVATVHQARARREERAQAVAKRAQEIEARSHIYARLMESYRGIGSSAGELTQSLVGVAGAAASEREAAVGHARTEVSELATRAKALVEEAQGEGFQDIARSAEQLRQQLHAALNKVALAVKPTN
jgi:chromosome segregation ATPase